MRGLAVTVTTTDVLKTRAFCRFKNGEDFENRETLKHRAYVLEIEGLSKTAVTEMTRFLGSSTIQVVCISASFATRLG